jgi:hypothetical protein
VGVAVGVGVLVGYGVGVAVGIGIDVGVAVFVGAGVGMAAGVKIDVRAITEAQDARKRHRIMQVVKIFPTCLQRPKIIPLFIFINFARYVCYVRFMMSSFADIILVNSLKPDDFLCVKINLEVEGYF